MGATVKKRTLGRDEARLFLVSHLGVARPQPKRGAAGVRAALTALGCIQLDPLDPMGTNADLVALARVDGIEASDVYHHVLPGHAFEHFAKERCLLPAEAFPHYRDRAVETPWWRTSERMKRISPALLAEVLAEVEERGPLLSSELTHRGSVKPLDWSGWKGTTSATTMALEMLWARCSVVVADRRGGKKRYDVPARALAHVHEAPTREPFERWALRERVRSAGLLATTSSPSWSMLRDAKKAGVVQEAVEDGDVVEVAIEGDRRTFLATAASLKKKLTPPDERMRILGPLDALVWDRALVANVFGFEYLWEVYKPAHQRRWGWYVHPLLHQGRLVGRIEGKREGDGLVVSRLWREPGRFDEDALDAALARHAAALGASRVRRGPRARRR